VIVKFPDQRIKSPTSQAREERLKDDIPELTKPGINRPRIIEADDQHC